MASAEMSALQAQIRRLEATVSDTTEGAQGLKAGGALCCKAVFHYAKATKAAKEASAAESEADAVVGAAAAAHAPSQFDTEPARAAAERERMRAAATADMASRAATLRTTIDETSGALDFLKALTSACSALLSPLPPRTAASMPA